MKKLKIEIQGEEEDDLTLAIEQVSKKVVEGFTSGHDENDTGSYSFEVSEVEP